MASRAGPALLAIAACACTAPALPLPQKLAVQISFVDSETLLSQLAPVPRSARERKDRLAGLFARAGCRQLEERFSGGSPYPNVLCTLPGATPATIVVGAHFDRPYYGRGVADNWSGVVLLPNLYRALRSVPRHHTFVFAGFTDVKRRRPTRYGTPAGSTYFLRDLAPGERDAIVAMVNLKGIGLGPTCVWAARADPNLRLDLYSVSISMGLPLRHVDFHNRVQADLHSFRRYGIPSILIHSFDKRTGIILSEPHRDRRVSDLRPEAYLETYRLVAAYLGYLDQTLELRRVLRASRNRSGAGQALNAR